MRRYTHGRRDSLAKGRSYETVFAVLAVVGVRGVLEVSLINADEWVDQLKLVYMPLVISAYDVPDVDVLLISGGVRTDEDLYKLRQAVKRAKQVVAVGTCAIFWGRQPGRP